MFVYHHRQDALDGASELRSTREGVSRYRTSMECWQLMVLTRVRATGRIRTGAVWSPLPFTGPAFSEALIIDSKGPKIQVEGLQREALIIFFFFGVSGDRRTVDQKQSKF